MTESAPMLWDLKPEIITIFKLNKCPNTTYTHISESILKISEKEASLLILFKMVKKLTISISNKYKVMSQPNSIEEF